MTTAHDKGLIEARMLIREKRQAEQTRVEGA